MSINRKNTKVQHILNVIDQCPSKSSFLASLNQITLYQDSKIQKELIKGLIYKIKFEMDTQLTIKRQYFKKPIFQETSTEKTMLTNMVGQYKAQSSRLEQNVIVLKQQRFSLSDELEDTSYELTQSKKVLIFLDNQMKQRDLQIQKVFRDIEKLKNLKNIKQKLQLGQYSQSTNTTPKYNQSHDMIPRFKGIKKSAQDLDEISIDKKNNTISEIET